MNKFGWVHKRKWFHLHEWYCACVKCTWHKRGHSIWSHHYVPKSHPNYYCYAFLSFIRKHKYALWSESYFIRRTQLLFVWQIRKCVFHFPCETITQKNIVKGSERLNCFTFKSIHNRNDVPTKKNASNMHWNQKGIERGIKTVMEMIPSKSVCFWLSSHVWDKRKVRACTHARRHVHAR